jgi:hypothetical protein
MCATYPTWTRSIEPETPAFSAGRKTQGQSSHLCIVAVEAADFVSHFDVTVPAKWVLHDNGATRSVAKIAPDQDVHVPTCQFAL